MADEIEWRRMLTAAKNRERVIVAGVNGGPPHAGILTYWPIPGGAKRPDPVTGRKRSRTGDDRATVELSPGHKIRVHLDAVTLLEPGDTAAA